MGETSTTKRAAVLDAIADAIEENLEMLAVAESWENGKPVRETLVADIPLAVDHFRYFAGAISEIDKETVVYHFREPLAVVSTAQGVRFRGVAALGRRAPGGRRG
jgi:aldehyde dehydrogenase